MPNGTPHDLGRWPPNVALDEAVAAQLDAMVGKQRDGRAVNRNRVGGSTYRVQNCAPSVNEPDQGYGGGGGPSRFFYCPKAHGRA